MTGTFKANIPYNNFLLFLYGLLLKWPLFLRPSVPAVQKGDSFLYKTLINWLSPAGNSFPHIYSIIIVLLVYQQAISLNKLVNNQRLLPKPNYLTGMSYILLTSVFPGWFGLHAPLLVTSLLIAVLPGLCSLHNRPDAKTTLFNIGLITGLSILLYFPSIVFLILVLSGITITRTFRLPEWIIVFLGTLTPYYFIWAWIFLTNNTSIDLSPGFALSMLQMPGTVWAYIALGMLLLTIIVGLIFIQNNMRRLLVQSRKSWSILFIFLLVAILVPFLNFSPSFSYWILSATPLAVIMAAAFHYPDKKWFPQAMHWGLAILAAVMGYFYVMK